MLQIIERTKDLALLEYAYSSARFSGKPTEGNGKINEGSTSCWTRSNLETNHQTEEAANHQRTAERETLLRSMNFRLIVLSLSLSLLPE